MKYGPIPANLLERLALLAGRVPVPAVDALYGLMKTRSIMAGVRLGVFEAIGHGTRSSADLARSLAVLRLVPPQAPRRARKKAP